MDWATGRAGDIPLLERGAELGTLATMFRASARGTGGVALVTGAAAAGKTALVQTFAEHALAEGSGFVGAVASRAERALPLGVVRQLFAGCDLDGDAAARVKEALGDAALKVTVYEPGFETADQDLAATFSDLCTILMSLAESRPLLIAVDDVHEADVASLQFLLYLIRRASWSSVLVVLTEAGYLLAEHPLFYAAISQQPRFERIQLTMLSRESIAQMFAQRTDEPTADRLATACYAATGGNPLLVRGLIEDYHGPLAAKPSGLVFGDSFSQSVLTCLFRCRPVVLLVAQAVAVLGESASAEILARVLDLDAGTIAQSLGRLRACGVLMHGRFRHVAARTAVLDGLRVSQREAIHARAAEVLYSTAAPVAVVAQHIAEASPAEAPWAVPVLREAAEDALNDGDVPKSISYLRLAQRLSTDDAEQALIEYLLALAEWRVNPSWGSRHLPRLSQAIKDGLLSSRQVAMPIMHLLWHGHTDEAIDVLKWLSEAEGDHEGAMELRFTYLTLRSMYPALSDMLGAKGSGRSDRQPRETPDEAFDIALTRGMDEDILARIEGALQSIQLTDMTVLAANGMVLALAMADEWERAGYWCQAMLAEATSQRAPTWQAMFAATQAMIDVRTGNIAAAAAHSDEALSYLSAKSWGVALGGPLATMLIAKTAMGRYDEAEAYLKIPVPDAMFRTTFGMRYLRARGLYFLATNRPHAALSDFRAYGEGIGKWSLGAAVMMPWQIDAARAYLAMDKVAEARKLLTDLIATMTPGRPFIRGKALRVLALTQSPKDRLRMLRESVEILQEEGNRWQLAEAYADLSQAHRALGEYSQARMVAGIAHRLAEQCGVESLRQTLIVDEYHGPGTTAEDVGLAAALSDAQRRVAELASRGYTNRQIATKLFITVSTVEQHLTRVYRKLQVSSRAELVAKLQALPGGAITDPDDAAARPQTAETGGPAAAGSRDSAG